MDGQVPSFELPNPQPVEKLDGKDDASERHHVANPEVNKQPPEPTTGAQPAVPVVANDQSATSLPNDDDSAVSVQHLQAVTVHQADNPELIDKVWVEKAKQVIKQTRDDPYSQNKQVNKVKAEFMKATQNKDMKVKD